MNFSQVIFMLYFLKTKWLKWTYIIKYKYLPLIYKHENEALRNQPVTTYMMADLINIIPNGITILKLWTDWKLTKVFLKAIPHELVVVRDIINNST